MVDLLRKIFVRTGKVLLVAEKKDLWSGSNYEKICSSSRGW